MCLLSFMVFLLILSCLCQKFFNILPVADSVNNAIYLNESIYCVVRFMAIYQQLKGNSKNRSGL